MNYNLNGAFDGIDILNKAPSVINLGEGRRYVKTIEAKKPGDLETAQFDSSNGKVVIVYQEERLIKKQSLFKKEKWDGPYSVIEIRPISTQAGGSELKVVLYLEKVNQEGASYLLDVTEPPEKAGVRFPGDVNIVLDALLATLRK